MATIKQIATGGTTYDLKGVYAETTADTTNSLYPVGVTSGATTTLKRDTSLVIVGNTIRPSAATIAGYCGTQGYPWADASSRIWRIYGYGDSTLAQYGYFYAATYGTKSTTEGTAGTQGVARLMLGNGTAISTTLDAGSNNARGTIRLYGTGTNYTDIYAQANGNRTLYLPNYAGTMYLAHTANNNAIGSYTAPVYVAANGRLTAGLSVTSGTGTPSGGSSGDVYIQYS